MLRHVHYEAAFEDLVRSRGWPYVPIDERRKAIIAGSHVKTFDFLVYPPGERAWLVDVKGRQFPYTSSNGRRYWENWVTRGDLDGLERWQGVFGPGFEPGLVFAYWLRDGAEGRGLAGRHDFCGEGYSFLWISASAYAACARTRSAKWDTVSVPARAFRDLISWVPGAADCTSGAG